MTVYDSLFINKDSKIICISADKEGAGRTYLADRIGHRASLTDFIKKDLQTRYPGHLWFMLSNEEMSRMIVEETGKTMRVMIFEHAKEGRSIDPLMWIKKIAKFIDKNDDAVDAPFIIDDVNFLNEKKFLEREYPDRLIHIHMKIKDVECTREESKRLEEDADYVMFRN
jgi:hypothetical protein